MPLQLKIEPVARRDLLEILRYIAKRNEDWEAAEQFGGRLIARCRQLQRAPGSGSPYRPRSGCRKIVEGVYKIIYREESGAIVILRIWDGRRGSAPRL